MKKNINRWKWFGLLMLLCNIGLLLLILLRPGHGHGGPRQLDAFLISELQLTDQQQEQFQELKQQHRSQIQLLKEAGKTLRNTFFSQLKQGVDNDAFVAEQSNAIGMNQQQIEQATYNHFKALRKILNASQQEKFDEIILEVLHRMAPPPPPHR